MMRFRGQTRLH